MIAEATLVIVGAGPAGCAAAIWAARCGVDAVVLDWCAQARDKPGETLHPGIEPLLERLGVSKQVLAADFVRHEGHWVEWNGLRTFSAYGADANGPWRGFQVDRRQFETILLNNAVERGVTVIRPIRARNPILSDGRVSGLELDEGVVRGRFVIDAGGGSHWLAHHLQLPIHSFSRKLVAQFGYSQSPVLGDATCPVFRRGNGFWTWCAPVGVGRNAIVHLDLSSGHAPPDFGCRIRFRGANVTWRMFEESSGPGYFAVGDAAAVLDPSTSHGVLRAITSGMLAADLVAQVTRGLTSEIDAIAVYRSWMSRCFWRDATRLRQLYKQAGQRSEKSASRPLSVAPSP